MATKTGVAIGIGLGVAFAPVVIMSFGVIPVAGGLYCGTNIIIGGCLGAITAVSLQETGEFPQTNINHPQHNDIPHCKPYTPPNNPRGRNPILVYRDRLTVNGVRPVPMYV